MRYSTKIVDATDSTPGAIIVFINPELPLYGITIYSVKADGGDIELGLSESYRADLAAQLRLQLDGKSRETKIDRDTLNTAVTSSWRVSTTTESTFEIFVQTVETNDAISPPVTYTIGCNVSLDRHDFEWLVDHLSIRSPSCDA